VLAVTGY